MFRPVKGTATKIFASVLCSVFLQKKKETDIEIISFPIKSSGIESVAHQNFICFTKKKKKKKKLSLCIFSKVFKLLACIAQFTAFKIHKKWGTTTNFSSGDIKCELNHSITNNIQISPVDIFLQWSDGASNEKTECKSWTGHGSVLTYIYNFMSIEIILMQTSCSSTFPVIVSTWPSFNNAVFFMATFHLRVTRLLLLELPGGPAALASLKEIHVDINN